jgi:hypothetical protein
VSCPERILHLVPWSSSVTNITATVTVTIIIIVIVIIIYIVCPTPERADFVAFCCRSRARLFLRVSSIQKSDGSRVASRVAGALARRQSHDDFLKVVRLDDLIR